MSTFTRPSITLSSAEGGESSIRSLPELVDFHKQHNPHHLFCVQAEKGGRSVPVTYETLHQAIRRCQHWLGQQDARIRPPSINSTGQLEKCTPVAVLMESHVGLVTHVLSCMGMGVPVVLLSARLSAAAVRHLIQETGAKLVLVSPRLRSVALEAFPDASEGGESGDSPNNGGKQGISVAIRVVAGYETFLEKPDAPGTTNNESQPVAHESHYLSEDDRQVMILHSSGTSGLPKPIPCSHRYFLGYATCHNFSSQEEAQGMTISTLPFYHGFGFVAVCLSLSIGKTVCAPQPSTVPNGASIVALIRESGAKALLTVPSILEEIESLPENEGHEVLRQLDFVGFGGGMPKESVGARLESAGVKLIGQYGATETGPMTPFFVPTKGHNWRQLRLRQDILGPLRIEIEEVGADPDRMDHVSDTLFSYKLSMKPFGWRSRFELQDLIVSATKYTGMENMSSLDFCIAGRTDDLIRLATGEKVRPTILESLLQKQEGVRAATAFGDEQFELGVIVEASRELDEEQKVEFRAGIWPAIEEAGRQMDAHARLTSPAAVLVVGPGCLPRSDKGTILRNAVTKKFASEMADMYRDLEVNMTAPPLDLHSPAASLRVLAAETTGWRVDDGDWLDDDDFFARGMDSLQATKLRRLFVASVRSTRAAYSEEACQALVFPGQIPDNIVYLRPSIRLLAEAVTQQPKNVSNTDGSEADLIERLAEKYSARGEKNGTNGAQKRSAVLVTGATGSLGSFFVGQLLRDHSVSRVICLNRAGKEGDPTENQKQALRSRGISVHEGDWDKMEVIQTDTSASWLGLGAAHYQRLAEEVTHIMHIAWPMNFKMTLQSFDASFRSLQNLIRLARKAAHSHAARKPRVMLISSISTVGNYPSVQSGDGRLVPEVTIPDASWALEIGYAKAKLVCEKMIQRAAQDYGAEMEVGFVRVGQVAGASNGYWNPSEHFVAVCASSQKLGKFPELHGTLSWLPVDAAAQALSEMLFHHEPLQLVYHLENPYRQGWEDVVAILSRELQIPSIVPLEEWLEAVGSAPRPGNPAANLVGFLRHDFVKMSCGALALDTTVSRSRSATLDAMGPVSEETIGGYVSYWRRIKLFRHA